MAAVPIMMTYIQALASFRQEVNSNHLPSVSHNTRRIQQINRRGRGGKNFRGRRCGRDGRVRGFHNNKRQHN